MNSSTARCEHLVTRPLPVAVTRNLVVSVTDRRLISGSAARPSAIPSARNLSFSFGRRPRVITGSITSK